ncbi:MAG: acyl-CoA dehydrogenase family protein [Myxococcota bacterium]|nr:acyl-CoA dehydrogenase family protein [Myxococcota bacterium]
MDPSDELLVLVETTRQFANEELLPAIREAEQARGPGVGARAAFEQIGLSRLELPESLDGAGLGAVARVLVNEELAAADPGAAWALDPLGGAFPVLAALGDAALERFGLPRLDASQGRVALAWAPECALTIEGERVDGSVAYVPCEAPDLLALLAPDSVMLVADGITAEPVRGAGLRAAGGSQLRLEGASVAARVKGSAAAKAVARVRLQTAALLLGVMRHACEFSRAYALEREAFGKPIAHHQALAFLITDMQMALDGARLLVHEAAWRLDAGLSCVGEAASAFAQCIEAQRLIGPSGVQILGGHGFMADYPMEKAMREARALALLVGGFDAAVECAGQELTRTETPLGLELAS